MTQFQGKALCLSIFFLVLLTTLMPDRFLFCQNTDTRLKAMEARLSEFENINAAHRRETLDLLLELGNFLKEANGRIDQLEAQLARIEAKEGQPLQNNSDKLNSGAKAIEAWKDPTAWTRVKDGMSSAQVISLLGKPSSVRELSVFKTLFYSGEVRGSGSVSGNVELKDDRVWAVNVPVF